MFARKNICKEISDLLRNNQQSKWIPPARMIDCFVQLGRLVNSAPPWVSEGPTRQVDHWAQLRQRYNGRVKQLNYAMNARGVSQATQKNIWNNVSARLALPRDLWEREELDHPESTLASTGEVGNG